MFHDRSLLGRCFRGFVLPVLECCSAVWCPAANTHLKLLDHAVSGARSLTGDCLSVTLLVVDLWQSCVCMLYKIRCNPVYPLNGIYMDHMCQCGLHTVLWWHIGTLMHHLAAQPRSTAGLLFPSRCPSGTILLTQYSMVWDWRVSRAGPMLFY